MRRGAAFVACVATACASPAPGSYRPDPLPTSRPLAPPDPTLRGARLVPETLDVSAAAMDASGGLRGSIQGIRFRVDPRGGVRTAYDRIEDPSQVVAVPERLGGGFLLVAGDTVYRADDWLAPPRPLFRSLHGVSDAFIGLDRIYLRTKTGAPVGLDPRTGSVLDLGPWPADPLVGTLRALDGWCALAITDIRGVVGTTDAGHSWTTLDIPIRAQTIVPVARDQTRGTWVEAPTDGSAEALVVSDAAPRRATRLPATPDEHPAPARCYLVSRALVVSPLASCSEVRPLEGGLATAGPATSTLRAAIEDGWPIGDRTALVVTSSGSVARVSLDDGTIVEAAPSSLDPDLGPCHAVALGGATLPSGFGFICGGAHASTSLLAYDGGAGRVRSVRRFRTPRLVETSGNGAWLVHGSCREDDDATSTTYCVGTPVPPVTGASPVAYAWRDVRVAGAADAIATITSDGSLARVTGGGDLSTAKLTLTLATGETREMPLGLAEDSALGRRVLSRGVLQNGLEERKPGVLSGWIRVDGTVVGIEVSAEGAMRLGMSIRDLGHPFVSGRYGLGWTRARVAYETTDGGMTWTPFPAPTPLGPSAVRACGPAGCVANGWLRVGWGEHEREASPPLRPSPSPRIDGPALRLTCRTIEPFAARPARAESVQRRTTLETSAISGGNGRIVLFERAPRLGALQADSAFEPPTTGRAERLLGADVFHAFDPTQGGPVGRIYAWGPAAGEWSGAGRWMTRWRPPFGGKSSVRSTAVAPAPFFDAESAHVALGNFPSPPVSFTAEVSQDATHALIAVKRASGQLEIATADEGGMLALVHRADGAPWAPIDAAIRVGPDWFLAVPADARHGSVDLLRVTDGVARTIASIPRLVFSWSPSSPPVRLAYADGGNLVGVVLDGERTADGGGPTRWVVPVDLDSGSVGLPESLGAADLSDRSELSVCNDRGASGWEVETTWPNPNVTLDLGDPNASTYLQRMFARLRLSGTRACIERLSAEATDEPLERAMRSPFRADVRAAGEPTLPVSLRTTGGSEGRALLTCAAATK